MDIPLRVALDILSSILFNRSAQMKKRAYSPTRRSANNATDTARSDARIDMAEEYYEAASALLAWMHSSECKGLFLSVAMVGQLAAGVCGWWEGKRNVLATAGDPTVRRLVGIIPAR